MSWGIVASIGGAVIGGAMSADASEDAAQMGVDASRDATQAQREMFDKQVELQQPWRDAGGAGLNRLAYELGLSPTGFYRQGGGASGAGGSIGGNALAPMETEAQIRERLRAQFTRPVTQAAPAMENRYGNAFEGSDGGITGYGWSAAQPAQTAQAGQAGGFDQAGYDAAVNAELARMQQMQQQQATATANASTDPQYGNLLRDFGTADFEADPGYAFRKEEQERALQRAAAASGGLGSGRYLKDAMRYSGGLAAQEYGASFDRFNVNKTNRFNRLASVAGIGQTAANQTGAAAGRFGTQWGDNIMTGASAAAAGRVGSSNALTGAIGKSTSMYAQDQMMRRPPTSYSGWGINGSNTGFGTGSQFGNEDFGQYF